MYPRAFFFFLIQRLKILRKQKYHLQDHVEQCAQFPTLCFNTVRYNFYPYLSSKNAITAEEIMVMGHLGLMYEGISARPVALGPLQMHGPLPGYLPIWLDSNTKGTEWQSQVRPVIRTGSTAYLEQCRHGQAPHSQVHGVLAGLYQRGIYKDQN